MGEQKWFQMKRLFLLVPLLLLTACGQPSTDSTVDASEQTQTTGQVETVIQTEICTQTDTHVSIEAPTEEAETSEIPQDTPEEIRTALEQQLQQLKVTDMPESDEGKVYQQFLENKCPAVVSDEFYEDVPHLEWDLIAGEEWYLGDLVEGTLFLIMEDLPVNICSVDYDLVDCGENGKKALAVRFLLDYWADYELFQMMFYEENGELSLTYASESWVRNDTDINALDYVWGGGSGGADYHYIWFGIFNTHGIYESLCEVEVTHGDLSGAACDLSLYDLFDGGELPMELSQNRINGQEYYSYYIDEETSEEVRQKCEEYLARCESQNGIEFLTYEEMDEFIAKREEELGVTIEEIMDDFAEEKHPIEWKTLIYYENAE